MAELAGFDAREIEPAVEFAPLPAGKYIAAIVESETKPTKAGDGSYLQLKLQILEGEHKSRCLFDRLNLENKNPLAVQIARATLSAICHAVGVMAPKDSTELHNLPLQISVKCRKRDDNGEMTNEIKGYAKRDAKTEPAPNGDNAPPWKRS